MMRSHAVRAGRVRSLGLLLIVLNGCGAQRCQGSAASGDPARSAAVAGSPLPAAPAAIPAVASPTSPAAALVPSGGEGSEAAAAEGSGSADEGSGIPPGMPEEGSPAYALLVERLCASLEKLTTGCCGCASPIYLRGGTDGDPRKLVLGFAGGTIGNGWIWETWIEQPDGTWQGPEVKEDEGPADNAKITPYTFELLPNVERTARHPSEEEIAAAETELTQQRVFCRRDQHEPNFIDLDHDGQTECVNWHWVQCDHADIPWVYQRGADGRWAEDFDAINTYFKQVDYE